MSRDDGARTSVPYKELDYFDETAEDRQAFAGREREIREVAARMVTTRSFVLYGRSGLGKTSLLRAGVFPLLRQEGFLPVYVRTLDAPLDELAAALRDPRRCPMDPPADPEESLESLVERAGGDHTLVLVFDQFEEFFTRFAQRKDGYVRKRRARAQFVARIAGLVMDHQRDVRIVFSLREDYLHALDAFQRRLPNLFDTAYRLLPLTATGAREAIIKPLLRDGVAFDERVVTRLVDELAEFDFESARLQIACAELYRASAVRDGGSLELRATDLAPEPAPGARPALTGVFKRYLQGAIDQIDARRHLLARALLDVLFAAKGTKYALALRSLVDYGFGSTRGTCAVLRALWKQKILRRERREGHTWYELRHECLVEPIEEWLNENEDFANYRQVRDIIKANARDDRFRDRTPMLLSHDQLERLVAPNKERFRLEDLELEFVLLSAIYDRSPDVAWWAQRFGHERADELLLARLTQATTAQGRDLPMLLGAATAAGLVQPVLPEIADRCLDLALNPTLSPELQRAAGRSLATRIGDAHFVRIKRLKRLWRTRRVVKELLADLHEGGRLHGRLGWVARRAARIRAEKRRVDSHAGAIREAGGEGAIAGAWGGLAWACSSGAILLCLLSNGGGQPLAPGPWLLSLAGIAAAAATFGAPLGVLFARGMARTLAGGSTEWSVAVRCSGVFLTIVGVTAFTFLWTPILALTNAAPQGLQLGVFMGSALAAVLGCGMLGRWLLAKAAGWVRVCMWGNDGRWRRGVRAIAPILVLTVLLPGTLFVSVAQSWLAAVPTSALLFSAACSSWLLTVACLSMDAVAPCHLVRLSGVPRLPRWIAYAGTLAIVPWWLLSFGYDSLPLPRWALPRAQETNHGTIECPLALHVWPDTSRVRIDGRGTVVEVAEVTNAGSASLDGIGISSGNFLFLPASIVVLAATNEKPERNSVVVLTTQAVRIAETLPLEATRPIFAEAELRLSPAQDPSAVEAHWVADWQQEVARPAGHETDTVLAQFHVVGPEPGQYRLATSDTRGERPSGALQEEDRVGSAISLERPTELLLFTAEAGVPKARLRLSLNTSLRRGRPLPQSASVLVSLRLQPKTP